MADIAPRSDSVGFSIPSYQYGTDYVPRTGPALIHEGEKITPANENGGSDRPIVIRVELDGREIASAMIDQNETNQEYVVSLRKAVKQ
jgi:hypothetical protein